jgi:hypothetical protein
VSGCLNERVNEGVIECAVTELLLECVTKRLISTSYSGEGRHILRLIPYDRDRKVVGSIPDGVIGIFH